MVVSEPSGETETQSNTKKESNNETNEENNVENIHDPSETQDGDSDIEVKGAITEKNTTEKSEPAEPSTTTTQSKSSNGKEETSEQEELKSPESLKVISDRVIRNSTSSLDSENLTSSNAAEDEFASFESAFPKGWFYCCF